MILEGITVLIEAPHDLRFNKFEIDTNKIKPDEIIAKTIYSAISPGTEVAAFLGLPQIRHIKKPYPRLVGYCNIAKVIAVGKNVKNIKINNKILTLKNHCSLFKIKKSDFHLVIPRSLSAKKASLTYLYHLGYNALLKSNATPGMNIAVLGLGPIGLVTVELAKYFGYTTYAISDYKVPRSVALSMGADGAFPKSRAISAINKLEKNTGIDIVISTSNKWSDWQLALKLAHYNGTICVLGFPGRSEGLPTFNPLDSNCFYYKQLKIVAAGFSPNCDVDVKDIRFTQKINMDYLIKLILKKKIHPTRLISGTCDYKNLELTYNNLIERKDSPITYLIKW